MTWATISIVSPTVVSLSVFEDRTRPPGAKSKSCLRTHGNTWIKRNGPTPTRAIASPLYQLNADNQDWCRSEEHTSELQSQSNLVCRLLLEQQNPRPALLREQIRGELDTLSITAPAAELFQVFRNPHRSPASLAAPSVPALLARVEPGGDGG